MNIAELKENSGCSLKLYDFEKFDDGSGYRMKVNLRSIPFSCESKELYFENLETNVSALEKAQEALDGVVLFKFRYEDDELKIEYKSLGHVVVSAKFSSFTDEYQSVSLCFSTDQSYMVGFIGQLKSISNALHC
ncbi:hypothetical protein ACMZOO_19245 (plasmid) [Catenovulum sp. SX2]|uniref:hypothetical protein n=1 Tax=Catenovulum sp. SX2 TaxID=3398614 RepID=UPI003F8328C6